MLRNKCTLHCKCALCICLSLSRSVISSKSNQIHTQNGLSKEITIRIVCVCVCVCVDWIQSFHQKQRYYIYILCVMIHRAQCTYTGYIIHRCVAYLTLHRLLQKSNSSSSGRKSGVLSVCFLLIHQEALESINRTRHFWACIDTFKAYAFNL